MSLAKSLVPTSKLKDRQQRTVKQWAEHNAKFKERFGVSKRVANLYRTVDQARQSEEAQQEFSVSAAVS